MSKQVSSRVRWRDQKAPNSNPCPSFLETSIIISRCNKTPFMTHSSALLSSGLSPLIPSLPEQTMRAFGARAVREPPRSRRCPEQVDGQSPPGLGRKVVRFHGTLYGHEGALNGWPLWQLERRVTISPASLARSFYSSSRFGTQPDSDASHPWLHQRLRSLSTQCWLALADTHDKIPSSREGTHSRADEANMYVHRF